MLPTGPPANERFKRAREEAPACGASHGFRPLLTASCPALQEMYLERRGSDPLCQLEESPNYI